MGERKEPPVRDFFEEHKRQRVERESVYQTQPGRSPVPLRPEASSRAGAPADQAGGATLLEVLIECSRKAGLDPRPLEGLEAFARSVQELKERKKAEMAKIQEELEALEAIDSYLSKLRERG